jgi:4-oxalocrotonate tautomerase
MPITTVKVIEGVLSDDQKARLIDIINKAMVKVEGEGMRELTWVIIEEVKRGDWAIGGTPISRNRDRPPRSYRHRGRAPNDITDLRRSCAASPVAWRNRLRPGATILAVLRGRRRRWSPLSGRYASRGWLR